MYYERVMPSLFSKPSKKSASTRRPLLKKKSKLSLKLIAPALAMVITLAGAGIATMLAQKSQENRGSASGCQYGATSCSSSTGLLWRCDGNSFQDTGEVCNESVANPPPENTSSWNADGTCIEDRWRCVDGFEQNCQNGVFHETVYKCGGVSQPNPGESCPRYDNTCQDGKYSECQCQNDGTNCSWQRRPDWDINCTSDYYEWGAGGGSGSTQTGSSQSSRKQITVSGFVACLDSDGTTYAVEGAKVDAYGWPNPSGWTADALSGPTGKFTITVPGNNDYAIRINQDWDVTVVKNGQRRIINGWKMGQLQAVHACTPKGAAGSINCTNLTIKGTYEGDAGFCSTQPVSSYEVCRMGDTDNNPNFDFLFTSCGF